jgi:hypothetical protein
MAIFYNRVRVQASTAGTGVFGLGTPLPSYTGFGSVPDQTEVSYLAVGSDGTWEIGLGQYSAAANTLSRSSIESSSNGNGLVNFAVMPVVGVVSPASWYNAPQAGYSNFYVYKNTQQSISAEDESQVTFEASLFDDLGEFDASTNAFVASEAGTYTFTSMINGNTASTVIKAVDLYVNGTWALRLYQSNNEPGGTNAGGTSGPYKLAAGDAVAIYYYTSVADTLLADNSAACRFSGYRIR